MEKPTYEELEKALSDLLMAINKRWEGEAEKKRANAISLLMEEAIENARRLLEA